jgi:hypothetical protein
MVIILLQELQSLVLAWPKTRAAGRQQTGKWASNLYVIVGISEMFENIHDDHHSVTPALAHGRSVNYSTAPRPKRRGFEFEKKSKKLCDTFEKKKVSDTVSGGCQGR